MTDRSRRARTVVAVAGRSGAGKDAVADALARAMGFSNLKFAKPLKDAAGVLFGLPPQCFEDRALKDAPHDALRGSTPRAVLQWLGTDVMQHGLREAGLLPGVGRGFWARRLISAIDALPPSQDRVVVSDMRFPHELELLRERYGGSGGGGGSGDRFIALKVVRPHVGVGVGVGVGVDDAHESESAVDGIEDVDAVIRNVGTLLELEAEAVRLVDDFRSRPELQPRT